MLTFFYDSSDETVRKMRQKDGLLYMSYTWPQVEKELSPGQRASGTVLVAMKAVMCLGGLCEQMVMFQVP